MNPPIFKRSDKGEYPRFRNRNNSLTSYSFACGYIEEYTLHGYRLTMYMEHGAYHVMLTKSSSGAIIRIFWETFGNMEMAKARRLYAKVGMFLKRHHVAPTTPSMLGAYTAAMASINPLSETPDKPAIEEISEAEELRRGGIIMNMLGLKSDRHGRIETQWGSKTMLGLYRTMKRVVLHGEGNSE